MVPARAFQVLLVVLLVSVSFGCKPPEAPRAPIVIGAFGPLSGDNTTFGTSTRAGAQIAVDLRNESGGLLGEFVRLQFENDYQTDPAKVIDTLIDEYKAVALLGEVRTAYTIKAAEVAERRGYPLVSFAATWDGLTDKKDWIYRVCFVDSAQGWAMGTFAANDLGLKRVAILQEQDSDYSAGLADAFRNTFKKSGGEIVDTQFYKSGDTRFRSQLDHIKTTAPQAIFIPGYYTEAGLIPPEARVVGLRVPLLGGDAWDSQDLFKYGGDDIEPAFFSNHYFVGDSKPENQRFTAVYKARYGMEPDTLAGLGFDAANVVMDAIMIAKSRKPQDIRDAIEMTSLVGVSGTIKLDKQNHSVKKPITILQVKDGKFQYKTTINPNPN